MEVGATTSSAGITTGQASDLRDVDVSEFLDLLIAELQNQDPFEPVKNSEMLQQIGLIREIGATDNLTDTLSAMTHGQNLATASSLIGKEVSALTDQLDDIQGVVDRVSIDVDENDETQRIIKVHIGEHTVKLTNVRQVVGNGSGESAEEADDGADVIDETSNESTE